MNWRKTIRAGVNTLIILILLSFPQLSLANPPTPKSRSPASLGWQTGYFNDGVDGSVTAIAVDGDKIYVGGSFSTAGNVVANSVAMWDGMAWHPLGSGFDFTVRTLAVDRFGHLYAGGHFTQAGGQPAHHIARWNGEGWQEVGGGVSAPVYAIAVSPSGDVYVGGYFGFAGDIPVNSIAKWDGHYWEALNQGISDPHYKIMVYAIAIDRYGFVYAGGDFTEADGKLVNHIARWDGENWKALGGGFLGDPDRLASVYSLAIDGRGNLYAGGAFSSAGGKRVSNLARWDGEDWWDVGGGVQYEGLSGARITSILADGGNIYISGGFNSAGGQSAQAIAKWDGSAFENLAGGMQKDFPDAPSVDALAIDRNGNIYAGGDYHLAGGRCTSNIAMWGGSDWQSLGSAHSLDGPITAIISDRQGGYYAAGGFVCASGQKVNHIAHWDGTAWRGLGTGLAGGVYLAYPYALALDQIEQLYVAGSINKAGGILVHNIAKWTGFEWQALGEGVDSVVRSLAVDSQNRIFVGGNFGVTAIDPPQIITVKLWDGKKWKIIGENFNDTVSALAVDGQDRLVADGYFTSINGNPAHGLARWDEGEWEAIVDEGVGPTRVLLISGNTIYGGGKAVWKIQDGRIEYLDSGFGNVDYDPWVITMTLDQKGRLIVGGQFFIIGGKNAPNIARWNGMVWESLGSDDANGAILSIIDNNDELIVGGGFDYIGGNVSNNLAVWHEPHYAWLPLVIH